MNKSYAAAIVLTPLLVFLAYVFWTRRQKPQKPAVSLAMSFSKDVDNINLPVQGIEPMETIKKGEVRIATVMVKDADGLPTAFDGEAKWGSSDATAFSIEPLESGVEGTYTAKCTSLKSNASSTITLDGDGSQGESVNTLSASGVLATFPADAATVEMTFSTPPPAAKQS